MQRSRLPLYSRTCALYIALEPVIPSYVNVASAYPRGFRREASAVGGNHRLFPNRHIPSLFRLVWFM